jgi:hydroxymethylbilane synthase
VRAERAVSRVFGGSCTVPLGAFAELSGGTLRLRALVASPDGRRVARTDVAGEATQPEALAELAAEDLRRQGAWDILK